MKEIRSQKSDIRDPKSEVRQKKRLFLTSVFLISILLTSVLCLLTSVPYAEISVKIQAPDGSTIETLLDSLYLSASDQILIVNLKKAIVPLQPGLKVKIDGVEKSVSGIDIAISISPAPIPISQDPTPCAKPSGAFPQIFWDQPATPEALLIDIKGDASYFGGWACWCPTNPNDCWAEYKK